MNYLQNALANIINQKKPSIDDIDLPIQLPSYEGYGDDKENYDYNRWLFNEILSGSKPESAWSKRLPVSKRYEPGK